MSVRYTDHTSEIILRTDRASSLFLRFLLDDIDRNAEPKTPMKEGQLRRGTLKMVLGTKARMLWLKEYAAAQEAGTTRGFPMVKYTTPGTGPHYARNAVQKSLAQSTITMRKAGLI